MWGIAARIPRVSGAYRGSAASGLSQTRRCAVRRSRASSVASTSGSPRSQPSESSDDERAAPDAAAVLAVQRGERVADPRAAAPVRHPLGRARERPVGVAAGELGVSRVIRVPNANASTRARAATLACTYWSSRRAYGAIEPETSRTSTTRRGRSRRRPPAPVAQLAAVAQRRARRRPQVVDARPRAPRRPRAPASARRGRAPRERARAAAAPPRARRPCTRRSPCSPQQLLRRSTPAGTARSSVGAGLAGAADARARHRDRAAAPRAARSSPGSVGARDTASNAASKRARSARDEHSVARSARARRRAAARPPRARGARRGPRPTPTAAPPRAHRAATAERRSPGRSATGEHPALAHALEVLAHLQRDAERGVEVASTAREQRPRPGDRLPDARAPCRAPRRAAARPRRITRATIASRHARQPRAHDLRLALRRG